MMRYRRIMGALAASCLCLTFGAACGGSGDTKSDPEKTASSAPEAEAEETEEEQGPTASLPENLCDLVPAADAARILAVTMEADPGETCGKFEGGYYKVQKMMQNNYQRWDCTLDGYTKLDSEFTACFGDDAAMILTESMAYVQIDVSAQGEVATGAKMKELAEVALSHLTPS